MPSEASGVLVMKPNHAQHKPGRTPISGEKNREKRLRHKDPALGGGEGPALS